MAKSKVGVTYSGPLFDGRAAPIIRLFLKDAVGKVSDMGDNALHARMAETFKHPTGHYASRVHTNRVSDDRIITTDGGVIYGPWLEGTSQRNAATRFKGYKNFRKTRLWLRKQATPEAQRLFESKYLPRLTGDGK